jgi:hypothetical protein
MSTLETANVGMEIKEQGLKDKGNRVPPDFSPITNTNNL